MIVFQSSIIEYRCYSQNETSTEYKVFTLIDREIRARRPWVIALTVKSETLA
jgi:hypothetical protein